MMATSPTGSSACHRRRRTPPPEVWLCTTLLTALLFLNDTVLAQKVIDSLPGFPGKLPFRLETGYVGVGEKEDVQLFYYFVESDGNPKEDPLILWMTGGPGCSSISGFIYRIGPLRIDAENSEGTIPTLILNEYAWTKMANIIFLDQPAGTGFSYSKPAEGSYSNDTLSSKMVHDFIKKGTQRQLILYWLRAWLQPYMSSQFGFLYPLFFILTYLVVTMHVHAHVLPARH